MIGRREHIKLNIIPVVLGIFVIASIGANIYLYNKSLKIHQNISNIQSEVENRASEEEQVASQIENNKQSLSDIQSENSELSKKVKK